MLITASALLLLAAPAVSPAAGVRTLPQKPSLICRRERAIGLFGASRRICMTKEQWAQRDNDDGNLTEGKMVYDIMGPCVDPSVCPR